jgi:hypothetical protein
MKLAPNCFHAIFPHFGPLQRSLQHVALCPGVHISFSMARLGNSSALAHEIFIPKCGEMNQTQAGLLVVINHVGKVMRLWSDLEQKTPLRQTAHRQPLVGGRMQSAQPCGFFDHIFQHFDTSGAIENAQCSIQCPAANCPNTRIQLLLRSQ